MSAQEWAAQALQSFEAAVQSTAGFRPREGQRRMAEQVAQTFAQAQFGKLQDEDDEPQRAIAVVQAGTGVGKSLAYSAPAIAMALARGTRVLISTATVALQEQLVHKDLPQLAARMEQPLRFALAKGRGRYVCKLKLERLAGGAAAGEDGVEDDDLFPDEEAERRSQRPRHESEARMKFYATMADALATGGWDGDRDTLATPPSPRPGAPWRPRPTPAPASTVPCSAAAPTTTAARSWWRRRSSWPTTTCCCRPSARGCCPSWTTACWSSTKPTICPPRRSTSSPARPTCRA